MKHGNWLRNTVLAFTVLILQFCSVNPLAPEMNGGENGIPQDQITWVNWNPETIAELEGALDGALPRRARGYESKKIHSQRGGTVGGRSTFGNFVEVPEDAFDERKLDISVRVLHVNAGGQTAAGVEFLPSRNYDADVRITLSWEFLDVEGDDWESLNLQPYYSEDQGVTWFPVEDFSINADDRTISFSIDHFTQYGWALDEDD